MKAKLIGALAALALAGPTMAATCTSQTGWAPLGPPGLAAFGQAFTQTGNYLDCYTFSLGGPTISFGGVIGIDPSLLGLDLNYLAIDITSVSLFNGGVNASQTGSLFDADNTPADFTFSGLTAGTYTLAVATQITRDWGIMPGPVGYVGSIATASAVASPAPEPESLAMMLAGLAGVGAVARRRRA